MTEEKKQRGPGSNELFTKFLGGTLGPDDLAGCSKVVARKLSVMLQSGVASGIIPQELAAPFILQKRVRGRPSKSKPQVVGGLGTFVVPKKLLTELGFGPGTPVFAYIDGASIVVSRAPVQLDIEAQAALAAA